MVPQISEQLVIVPVVGCNALFANINASVQLVQCNYASASSASLSSLKVSDLNQYDYGGELQDGRILVSNKKRNNWIVTIS